MIGRLDHVGVVVDDLATARRFLSDALGLELVREVSLPEQSIEAAFYSLGNASIELIEVSDPAERERRLGAAGARIEHIAVVVDDLEDAAARLAAHGVVMTQNAPTRIGEIDNLWSRPETSGGVAYQLMFRRGTTQ